MFSVVIARTHTGQNVEYNSGALRHTGVIHIALLTSRFRQLNSSVSLQNPRSLGLVGKSGSSRLRKVKWRVTEEDT